MSKRSMFYGFDAKSYRLLGLGLELGLLIGGCTWLGYYLDGKWDTSPWLALSGALVATLGGSYTIYKAMMMKPAQTKAKKQVPVTDAPESETD